MMYVATGDRERENPGVLVVDQTGTQYFPWMFSFVVICFGG
jgi:hypothetical protein